MKSRRSRFRRLYRRLTRSTPNRKKQWQQISVSRSSHSSGHETTSGAARPHTAFTLEPDAPNWEPFDLQTQSATDHRAVAPPPSADPDPSSKRAVTVAVAALAGALLLLACAYVGLSGRVHSNNSVACLGVLGAVGSVIAAGIGVFMTASASHRAYSTPFMSIAVAFLTGLYGALFFMAASV